MRGVWGKAAEHHDGLPVVELHTMLPASIDLTRVPAAFGVETRAWLGEPAGTDAAGLQQYRGDLRLRVSPESRALFRKSAIVSLGAPRESPEGWLVPIDWRAATLAPLFPVFVGRLLISPERITIDVDFVTYTFGSVGPYAFACHEPGHYDALPTTTMPVSAAPSALDASGSTPTTTRVRSGWSVRRPASIHEPRRLSRCRTCSGA